VTLGRRRVPAAPASPGGGPFGALAVSTHELFSATEILGLIALERMLSGLTSCRHGVGLEPIGAAVTESATATSRSAVSRTTEIAHHRLRPIRPS
jgi:putative transposase